MNCLYILYFMSLILFAPVETVATDSQQQSVEAINISWSDDRAVKILIDDFELHFAEKDDALLSMPVEQDISFEVRVAGMDHAYTETVRIISGIDKIVIELNKKESESDDDQYSSQGEYELKISQQKMPVMIGGMQSLYDNVTYPRSAVRRNLEGISRIGFIVNTEGKVEDIRVEVSSGHSNLDHAAILAVEKLQFEPGTSNGNLARFKMVQPIVFRLR